MAEPLSTIEVTYKAIQEITMEIDSQTTKTEERNHYYTSIWAISLSTKSGLLDSTFPFNEAMEEMNLMENT